jgi:hypothetical protein
MPFEIPTLVPDKFTAGDSFQVRISSNDFPPASGWTLAISLRGPSKYDGNAGVDGTAYLFNVPGATTKTWAPGLYWWQLRVSNNAGEVHTLSKGRFEVVTDYSAVTDQNFSDKSPAEKCLDALLASQAGNATQTQQEYRIDGILVRSIEPGQRIMLIEKYQRMVERERQGDHLNPGKKRRNRVYTRFS